MSTVTSNTKKTAKQLAQDIAKKIAREPIEVLRTAGGQVSGVEKVPQTSRLKDPRGANEHISVNKEEVSNKAKSKRLIDALEAELAEIKKIKKQNDLEALQAEKSQELQIEKSEETKPFVEPSTKQKKGVLTGMKGKIDKLKKRAEVRMPPSG